MILYVYIYIFKRPGQSQIEDFLEQSLKFGSDAKTRQHGERVAEDGAGDPRGGILPPSAAGVLRWRRPQGLSAPLSWELLQARAPVRGKLSGRRGGERPASAPRGWRRPRRPARRPALNCSIGTKKKKRQDNSNFQEKRNRSGREHRPLHTVPSPGLSKCGGFNHSTPGRAEGGLPPPSPPNRIIHKVSSNRVTTKASASRT